MTTVVRAHGAEMPRLGVARRPRALTIAALLGLLTVAACGEAVAPDGGGGGSADAGLGGGGGGGADASGTLPPTTLSGRVAEAEDGQGIQFAIVATSPPSAAVQTNGQGQFLIDTGLQAGATYRVSASKPGYVPGFVDVTVLPGRNQLADIALVRGPDEAECFPLCRADFACAGGVCVPGCNPPCPLGQVCRNGACRADCTPDCGGRTCGPDPACVVSCGVCGDHETCTDAGRCACVAGACAGDCCAPGDVCADGVCCTQDCVGMECGPDPVCGLPCGRTGSGGECDDDDLCTADVCEGGACRHTPRADGSPCGAGQCVAGRCECAPECGGRTCGPDPVCGSDCGACGENETCTAAGRCECLANACAGGCCARGDVCAAGACCTPDCAGRECGPDPVCGASCGWTGSVGECDDNNVCTMDECGGGTCRHTPRADGSPCSGGQCFDGRCECVPACGARECGPDGCGASCGSCAGGTVCEDGACVVPCTDTCRSLGWECDSVCGESCGSCSGRERCEDGACVVPPLTLPFFEGFESGLALWTSTSTWGPGTVIAPGWHITSTDAASGTRSAWTGDEASGRTESGHHALVLAEPIELSGAVAPQLRFQYQKLDNASRTEVFYILHVSVSRNRGLSWDEIYSQGVCTTWMDVELDLASYAGDSILLKFQYDNSGWSTPGLFIDDIEVVDP